MNSSIYREKLHNAQSTNNSWVCVGLDPDSAKLPEGFEGADGARRFCEAIIESTQDMLCAFKPNLAFFLAYGSAGIAALEAVIDAVPVDLPVLLDAKVGDIGSTQRRYGEAAFGALPVCESSGMELPEYTPIDRPTSLDEKKPWPALSNMWNS